MESSVEEFKPDQKLHDRRERKRMKKVKETDNSNKVTDAIETFLKSENVTSAIYAEQQTYLKNVQTHFFNICKRPNLTTREFISVKILNGNSPKELFVLKKKDEQTANEFLHWLNTKYTNNEHDLVYCLKNGYICVAHTNDGWQRCRISKIHANQTCDVFCIDTGHSVRVSFRDLRLLNHKFSKLFCKPLANRCLLVDSGSASPINRVKAHLQQEFSRILQKRTDFYIFVNVASTFTSQIFLYYKFENEFYCVNNIFPCESDYSTSDEIAASSAIQSKNQSQQVSEHSHDIQQVSSDQKLIVSKMDQSCQISKPQGVIVNHIDGPDTIYISLKKHKDTMNNLQFDIQTFVEADKSIDHSDWVVGDYCLVMDCTNSGDWFRAKIISIDNDHCKVILRDAGKMLNTPLKYLKLISKKHSKIRDMAMKVKLAFIKLAKNCSLETFNSLLNDRVNNFEEVTISIITSDEILAILWGIQRSFRPFLPDKTEYININDLLVKWGVATSEKSFDAINDLIYPVDQDEGAIDDNNNGSSKSINDRDVVKRWLPSEPIKKSNFAAFPMYIGQNLNIHVLEESRKTIADNIAVKLQKLLKAGEMKKRSAIEWRKDDVCFARYGKRYYRASVRRVNFANNSCIVRFIDYGNCELLSLDELREANMFGEIPILARVYKMQNIKPIDATFWPESVRQFCIHLVGEKQCELMVDEPNSASDEIESCTLGIFNRDKDLASALIKRGYAQLVE